MLAPVAREPFQLTLAAVTAPPLCVTFALHACATVCPAPKAQRRVQPETGSPRFVIATLVLNPPFHWEPTV